MPALVQPTNRRLEASTDSPIWNAIGSVQLIPGGNADRAQASCNTEQMGSSHARRRKPVHHIRDGPGGTLPYGDPPREIGAPLPRGRRGMARSIAWEAHEDELMRYHRYPTKSRLRRLLDRLRRSR